MDPLAEAIAEYRVHQERLYRRKAQRFACWLVGIALAAAIAFAQQSELQGFWLLALSAGVTAFVGFIVASAAKLARFDDKISKATAEAPIRCSVAIRDRASVISCADSELQRHNQGSEFQLRSVNGSISRFDDKQEVSCQVWFQRSSALPVVARTDDGQYWFFE